MRRPRPDVGARGLTARIALAISLAWICGLALTALETGAEAAPRSKRAKVSPKAKASARVPPPSTAPEAPPRAEPPEPWGSGISRLAYPAARVEAVFDELHGEQIPDPYRWLENGESPAVIAWADAQDSLARARLSKLSERAGLARRLHELGYVETHSPPLRRGPYTFYKRRLPNQEKAVLYVREGEDGPERALIDPNTWTGGNWGLLAWVSSLDGSKVAYTISHNVMDRATLCVIDVATRQQSKIDVIEGARYAHPSWAPKAEGFYYTWIPTDPSIPPAQVPGYQEVRYHRLGEDPRRDLVVRERLGDPELFPAAEVSVDGRWLVLTIAHGWSATDVYFADLRARLGPGFDWKPLVVGKDAIHNVRVWKDRFYVHTNDGASRWRIFRVDPSKPSREAWSLVVPERGDVTIDKFTIAGERLVLTLLEDASSRIEIRKLDGSGARRVALPGIGEVADIQGSEDRNEAFFAFESFATPAEVHELNVGKARSSLWHRPKVSVDPNAFAVSQVFYRSKDSTRVPLFLVHRKDFRKDGNARVLLYGYGGFQIAMTPYFSPRHYTWVERGGVLAVACIRGGNEYGEAWHRGGMLLQKQNGIDDFIAAAEHLIQDGYTTPRRLAISGGSNGGLLVGAALTQRPELFRAVVCSQPLLDMIRYHKFGSGSTWVSEYGSAEDSTQFQAIYAYSPYHHVQDGVRYPAVLVLSPEHDDRVDPMHARKFVAALQVVSTGGPVLLRLEREAGHRGPDRVRASIESGADTYAFLLDQLGDGAP